MKKIEIEIPEGKRAEWVNGVLTLVEDEPIEFKFKVGDKVKITVPNNPQYGEITKLGEYAGEPLYTLKNQDAVFDIYERYLEPLPQDITERIKTFADAAEWCKENKPMLIEHWQQFEGKGNGDDDIEAYLQLRIITCALNEGWVPTYEMGEYGEIYENKFVPNFGDEEEPVIGSISIYGDSSAKLCFKSESLAAYAAKQFRDIYADFCGCEKGGEK